MSNIHFDEMRIRPYGPGDPLAERYPGGELFDDRSDFYATSFASHIAVSLTAWNTAFGDRRAPRLERWTLSLIDDDRRNEFAIECGTGSFRPTHDFAECILVSVDFSIRLNPWEAFSFPRIDLPVDMSRLALCRNYCVVLVRKGSRRPVLEHSLRLFSALTLPKESFRVTGAYIEADGRHLRRIRTDVPREFDICFEVDPHVKDAGRLPEAWVRVELQCGYRKVIEARQFMVTGDEGDIDGIVRMKLARFLWDSPDETVYAELRILGQPVAAVSFRTDADEAGEFAGGELKDFLSPASDNIRCEACECEKR